jgi:hypothetical protein
MQELYNCHRIDERHYKITKFDSDLNPVHSAQKNAPPRLASYICTTSECDCPAGHASSCRHRKMLPIFISNKKVDSNYFFIWDEHSWYKAPGIEFEVPSVDSQSPIEPRPSEDDGEWEGTSFDPQVNLDGGGAQAPASEVPSPQPSPAYRRF